MELLKLTEDTKDANRWADLARLFHPDLTNSEWGANIAQSLVMNIKKGAWAIVRLDHAKKSTTALHRIEVLGGWIYLSTTAVSRRWLPDEWLQSSTFVPAPPT